MAQLIKLQDYISRYEIDMFRYPSQFIRMKKDSYRNLIDQWKSEQEIPVLEEHEQEEKKQSFLKNIFKKNKDVNVWEQEKEEVLPLPESEDELKHLFLNQVFSFQLKWASSTLQEVSYLDQYYEKDPLLKYFLQRFPDTYLLLYRPIFKLKKAVIEGDVMIVTPTEILCLSILDNQNSETMYKPVDDRKWVAIENGIEHHMVNPLISLKRMEKMIKSILDFHQLEFPIKKIILAKNQIISEKKPPFQTEFIDQENHDTWFQSHRNVNYPIKFHQLKVTEALLEHTQKTFVERPIWKEEEDHMM